MLANIFSCIHEIHMIAVANLKITNSAQDDEKIYSFAEFT